MLNTEHFELLAGNPTKWDEETLRRVKAGESLPSVQEDQHRRGRRSAELVPPGLSDSYFVRAASGLDDFAVLHGPTSKPAARQWGLAWANEDPEHREFYIRIRNSPDQA